MSRDIRSFFMPIGSKKKHEEVRHNSTVKSKKRAVILDSDSDEDSFSSQIKKRKETSKSPGNKEHKKGDKIKVKTEEKPKLKPVNVADIFGSSQIKRTAPKKSLESKEVINKPQLEDQHSDSDFEATLQQIDLQESACKKEEKTPNKDTKTSIKESNKHKGDEVTIIDREYNLSPKKSVKKEDKHKAGILNDIVECNSIKHDNISRKLEKFKKEESKPVEKFKTEDSKPVEKFKKEDSKPVEKFKKEESEISTKNEIELHVKKEKNSPIDTKSLDDSFYEDVFEKKVRHAIQFQKYLHREGPKNPGGKEIPEGKPGCLSGLVFVVTGVLETIDRDETSELIKKYGGRVTSSVSRNTSYIVVGDEPGPSKIEKAMKLNTKQLTEDGLFDLIRTKTGTPDKTVKSPNIQKKKELKKDKEMKENKKEMKKERINDTGCEYLKGDIDIKKENKIVSDETEVQANIKLHSKSPKKSTGLPSLSTIHDEKSSSLWVDKYKPVSTKQIIGQQGDRSNVKKLLKWLENWHSNHSGKKKLVRPSPWAKDDGGSFFKASLLSGPPGVGKTTSAHLVCKELGFDVVEFNASDTRSKKLLHEEVSELLGCKSLSGYFQGSKPSEKHVLIMDEVDGMAGNEDRGGVQELIQLIKGSRVPIICMCNDRHHPKIRSLTNYCFDLQFSKPRVEQIRGAMMSVCYKEGIKIPSEALNDIINGANQDIRQVLHHLSLWSVKDKGLSVEQAKQEAEKAKKNIKLGPWDVLKKVFSADAHKTMSIHDKSDLFFHDYSLGPLFVHENYLGIMPHKAKHNKQKHLDLVAQTAECLSSGDIVEKAIRSRNAWSLLPLQAMFSSVLPGDIMEGHMTCQINFPAWLGKNSRRNKFHRLLQELHMHMRLSISGSKEAVNLDYLTHIRDSIVNPLIKEGVDGVPSTLNIMQKYYLMREDIDSLLELSSWPNQKDPMTLVDSKVKAALTRTYNKEGIMTPYSIVNIKKSTTKSSQGDFEMEEDLGDVQDEQEDDDITRDAMIKAKKRPASSRNTATGVSNAKRGKAEEKPTKKDKTAKKGSSKRKEK